MKIRPRMGMAVIDMAMAKNSWKPSSGGRAASGSRARNQGAATKPSANGVTMPRPLTRMTVLRVSLSCAENSNSRPTWNIKSTRPICAMATKAGEVWASNSRCIATGKKAPRHLGPSKRPARISPDTCVCPLRRASTTTTRVTIRIASNW